MESKNNFGLCSCGCGRKSPIATRTNKRLGLIKGQPCTFIQGHSTHRRAGRHAKEGPHSRTQPYEWNAFGHARRRCTNEKDREWKNYGGRGIEFRFTSFEQFFAELGPRPSPKHSLDRKENNGHYEPGNVRWATAKEQMKNRRIKMITEFSTKELLDELERRKT